MERLGKESYSASEAPKTKPRERLTQKLFSLIVLAFRGQSFILQVLYVLYKEDTSEMENGCFNNLPQSQWLTSGFNIFYF